ncbi:DNA excision repair protein ERCC-1-like isoform X2 [Myxocyprinus asiaticus]|uniref:DNA excision repair protein ERCC-1-like isoform X2 n=1 Tax=Myxocyprinus asiaticus TaxID=70543 RepID=UPI00222333B6|nr:DNA excision repair protein ERCC-1-like isoform X2 [Myxocyprinus asiaticus]
MEKNKFSINLDDSAFTKERSPVAPLFKAKDGQVEASSAQSAPPAPGQLLSYAEFIVQTKNRGQQGTAHGPEKQTSAAQSRNYAAVQSSGNTVGIGSVGNSSSVSGKPENEQQEPSEVPTIEQSKEDGQCSESCVISPHVIGSGNSIIVSPRQRGNPILKFVRNVPWEFGEVVPDYVLGRTTCALFLSVRYHNLNPNYIHERLKQLGQSFALRVLLVQVDVKDPHHALKELARICIMADCTLILAWSPEEAGRYLETYKSYEKKPADLLKEQVEKNYLSQSLEGIINASKEELVLCPGLGPQKARRLYDALHQAFIKTKKKESR